MRLDTSFQMITNNDTKLIKSLLIKKFRQKYNKFVVEGVKNINELLESNVKINKIFTTESLWADKNVTEILISENELKKISQLVQPNTALALCEIPQEKAIHLSGLTLALDDIRDPGNLGTIIRLADWFGIEQILCSKSCVDLYNPKVIQATMGSFTRVQINYVDLEKIIENYSHPIVGTFMVGENIYEFTTPENAMVVMGNEANGISDEIAQLITNKVTIPRFSKHQKTESLNVAMATGIVLSQLVSKKK